MLPTDSIVTVWYLRERGIADFIQHRATRGHPLDPVFKALNYLIGGLRFKVEPCFGTMKWRFHLDRSRYFGWAQVQAQRDQAAIGFNRLKGRSKLMRLQAHGVTAPA